MPWAKIIFWLGIFVFLYVCLCIVVRVVWVG